MATTELEMKKKIADALASRFEISNEELKAVYQEVLDFAQTLPEGKRSAFLWLSGMEALGMLVGD